MMFPYTKKVIYTFLCHYIVDIGHYILDDPIWNSCRISGGLVNRIYSLFGILPALFKVNDYTDERPRMRCTLYGRTSVYCTNIIRTNRPYNIGTIYGTNVLKILLYVQNSVVYDNCAHACRDFYSKQTQTAYLCPATWMTTPNSVLYTAKMLWLSAFVRIILVPEQSLPTHCWVQMKHTSLHS